MNKRTRLEQTIAGEQTDRPPVALWRHFPGDDQRAADLARSTVDFQKTYDWDFVNVVPANSYALIDYGAQDQWDGALAGTRTYTRRPITRSLDWTSLRALDPLRGSLGRMGECLQMVTNELGENIPVIQTIFSPMALAKDLADNDTLLRHMRTFPDRVHTGLNILTETTLRFIDSLKRLPIAGIYFVIEHANYAALSEDEYRAFGLPYDRKILESLPSRWWLNIVHLNGDLPMFKFAGELRGQVVQWHDRDTEPELAQGKTLFSGSVCGGLSSWQHLHQGTPSTVRDAARDAIQKTNARRFILSAGGTIPITTPLSNIRAARTAVEGA